METDLLAVAPGPNPLSRLSEAAPESALPRAVPLLARRDQDLGRRNSGVARRQRIVSQMLVEAWDEQQEGIGPSR